MNRFAALIDRLETARDDETAARVLADWLGGVDDPDRGIALGLLLGALPIARAGRAVLKTLSERLDPALLSIGREVAGELAETIALMWPGPSEPSEAAPSLPDVAAALADLSEDRAASAATLASWLEALAPAARVALLRLAAGQIAGMLPARTAQAALARLGDVPLTDVEAVWHAVAPPYRALFAWLQDRGPKPEPAHAAPFRHLARVRVWTEGDRAVLDPTAMAADPAWEGLRVLAVSHRGEQRLYSRRGVDVGARFPELMALLEEEATLEGVVLVRDAGGRFARAALEARLARSPRPGAGEPVLMLHDVLELGGENLRDKALRERRELLERIAPRLPPDRAALSPLTPLRDWTALARLKAEARALGAAGVILKGLDAPYTADYAWIEERCDPIRFAGVLLYVEWAPEGAFATIGVWDGGTLIPVAKAPLDDAGLAARITAYVSQHPFDRFGPVLQVTADGSEGLVVDAAFDAIERAPRRKAGVQLRGARLIGAREGASPRDASHLAELHALLG